MWYTTIFSTYLFIKYLSASTFYFIFFFLSLHSSSLSGSVYYSLLYMFLFIFFHCCRSKLFILDKNFSPLLLLRTLNSWQKLLRPGSDLCLRWYCLRFLTALCPLFSCDRWPLRSDCLRSCRSRSRLITLVSINHITFYRMFWIFKDGF